MFSTVRVIVCLLLIDNVIGLNKPHIIVIVADDAGWNDFGIHGSPQIPTPNLDAIGYNGHSLHKHYSLPSCTPSRIAFLTGQYPIRLGMQGTPLDAGEERYIDPSIRFLPYWLKKLGYQTYMIGKWHIGNYDYNITPNGRGFDYFHGYYNGYCGYFDYMSEGAYDLHLQKKPDWKNKGIYATHLFTRDAERIIIQQDATTPMFLYIAHLAGHTGKNGTELENVNPKEANERFLYTEEPKRRQYAEIIRQLDLSTGKVIKALADKKMLNDSIILWFSDNGGQTHDPFWGYSNYASNWPLRGQKLVLNEGGVRIASGLWSSKLEKKNFVNEETIHLTDWLPTLYAAAGGNVKDLGAIDGINQWPMFTGKRHNVERDPILLNIDERLGYEGILTAKGKWKLLNGTFPHKTYDLYYGESGRTRHDPLYDVYEVLYSDVNQVIEKLRVQPPLTEEIIFEMRDKMEIVEGPGEKKKIDCSNYCLFNLEKDPTEKVDVKNKNKKIFNFLVEHLNKYRTQLVPQKNKRRDPASNPKLCKGTWFTWKEKRNVHCEKQMKTNKKPTISIFSKLFKTAKITVENFFGIYQLL